MRFEERERIKKAADEYVEGWHLEPLVQSRARLDFKRGAEWRQAHPPDDWAWTKAQARIHELEEEIKKIRERCSFLDGAQVIAWAHEMNDPIVLVSYEQFDRIDKALKGKTCTPTTT